MEPKTFTLAEIEAACEAYADSERFDIDQFLYLLEHPEINVEDDEA